MTTTCTQPVLFLNAPTASDMMTPNPASIRGEATVKEAVAFLVDRAYSAAPVIDRAGKPIGVLSRADVLVHDREKVEYVRQSSELAEKEVASDSGEILKDGFQVESVDGTRVRDIMTPVVFSVTPQTPALDVIEQMTDLCVHRLFVVDATGVLIGVISSLDIVRNLRPYHLTPTPSRVSAGFSCSEDEPVLIVP